MKEITIKFEEGIANHISSEARQIGMTSEDLIKYIVGSWVREEMISRYGPMGGVVPSITSALFGALKDSAKDQLKAMASRGDLKCKNCTMPLTADDVEKGACHLCNGPIELGSGGG